MQIEKASIDSLNLAVYNPRKDLKETDPEYIKLKNSVEHFGYVEPVIVNKRNMTVVGGHQRIKVLKDLGYKDIEVVYVDLDINDEKALNIALNKISGDWDAEKLEDLLRDLSLSPNYDVELTGFTNNEIETLFTGDIDDLQKDLDEFTRELTEEEQRKRKAIYIQIGKDIKIEITGAQYDIVSALTPVEVVNRLTGQSIAKVEDTIENNEENNNEEEDNNIR